MQPLAEPEPSAMPVLMPVYAPWQAQERRYRRSTSGFKPSSASILSAALRASRGER
jgi:hypothetical protein